MNHNPEAERFVRLLQFSKLLNLHPRSFRFIVEYAIEHDALNEELAKVLISRVKQGSIRRRELFSLLFLAPQGGLWKNVRKTILERLNGEYYTPFALLNMGMQILGWGSVMFDQKILSLERQRSEIYAWSIEDRKKILAQPWYWAAAAAQINIGERQVRSKYHCGTELALHLPLIFEGRYYECSEVEKMKELAMYELLILLAGFDVRQFIKNPGKSFFEIERDIWLHPHKDWKWKTRNQCKISGWPKPRLYSRRVRHEGEMFFESRGELMIDRLIYSLPQYAKKKELAETRAFASIYKRVSKEWKHYKNPRPQPVETDPLRKLDIWCEGRSLPKPQFFVEQCDHEGEMRTRIKGVVMIGSQKSLTRAAWMGKNRAGRASSLAVKRHVAKLLLEQLPK